MKRAKKRGRRGAGLVEVDNPLVVGGFVPGSTRRPRESSRSSTGRIGRALSAGGGKSAPRPTRKASDTKTAERSANANGKAKKPAAAATSTPKRPVKKAKPNVNASGFLTPAPPDRGRQRRADGRAKDAHIKQAGFESRLLGHISGSGKRNQARRDSKNG